MAPRQAMLAVVTSLPNAVSAVYLARRGRGAAVLSTALNGNAINVIAGRDEVLFYTDGATEARNKAGSSSPSPSATPCTTGTSQSTWLTSSAPSWPGTSITRMMRTSLLLACRGTSLSSAWISIFSPWEFADLRPILVSSGNPGRGAERR